MAEDYERKRQLNIENNRKLLLSLKLAGPGPASSKLSTNHTDDDVESNALPFAFSKKKKSTSSTRQKRNSTSNSTPRARRVVKKVNPSQLRRSQRLQTLTPQAILTTSVSEEDSESDSEAVDGDFSAGDEESDDDDDHDDEDGRQEKRQKSSKRRREPTSYASDVRAALKRRRMSFPLAGGLQRRSKALTYSSRPDPKVFGHQVGTEVGDWWPMRIDCSQAGVHSPTVAGIAGNAAVGCWSIALSGGYEDDVDLGYAFTFTGSGGRDLKGTKDNPKNLRTAPQTSDQEFTGLNAAVKMSSETKKPIRVIRGFKNHSPFAPEEGYRYDGLYVVEQCWKETGQAGFLVCKFAFVRLPNQPKIPVKEERRAEAEQMYIDMGFNVQALPQSPLKRKAWTKSLAKRRLSGVKKQVVEDTSIDKVEYYNENENDHDDDGDDEDVGKPKSLETSVIEAVEDSNLDHEQEEMGRQDSEDIETEIKTAHDDDDDDDPSTIHNKVGSQTTSTSKKRPQPRRGRSRKSRVYKL